MIFEKALNDEIKMIVSQGKRPNTVYCDMSLFPDMSLLMKTELHADGIYYSMIYPGMTLQLWDTLGWKVE